MSDKKWTIQKLWQSAMRLAKWRRNYTSSPNRALDGVIPYVGTKTAIFNFNMFGVTQKTIHKVTLAFYDLKIELLKDYEDKPKKDGVLKNTTDSLIVAYNNEVYSIEKPSLKDTKSRVRCSCADYYFSFGFWNHSNGAQVGPRQKPYQRKTTHYPERNPNHYPGICKHVVNAALLMQTSKFAK